MSMDENPFKVPEARVADVSASGGAFIADGRRVAAGRGAAWFSEGWQMFRQAPGVWIGITVAFVIAVVGLSLIPLAGLLVNILIPVLIGGIMLGCKALDEGDELRFAHLFAGFSGYAGNLVLVGVIYLVGVIAIGIVTALSVGALGAGAAAMGGGAKMMGAMLVPILVALALILPLAMAVWYAPALVVFHEVPPFQAMKTSFFVSIKNFLPFLVYGLVFLVLAILATIPLGLGWLVLGPVTYCSVYASYKDMFTDR